MLYSANVANGLRQTLWRPALARLLAPHLGWILTVTVGVVAGTGAVVLVLLIHLVGRLAHTGGIGLEGAARIAVTVLVPAAGGLLAGLLIRYLAPEAEGSGIPETKVALARNGGRIPLRVVPGKLAACAISVGTGGSLGREGPTVQIAAALGSAIGSLLPGGRSRRRDLATVGAAAGIAAAFNTPIAAVTFTLEEVVGDLNARILGATIVAAVTASVVRRALLGSESIFHVPPYALLHTVELPIYVLVGAAAALLAAAVARGLLALRGWMKGLRWPAPLKPAAGGLAVGLLALVAPQVLGGGYETPEAALVGGLSLPLLVMLTVAKPLATIFSYGSGGSGGIFAPSLFTGAMLGGTIGAVAHALLPDLAAGPGAYALVGMGAFFAAFIRAPITSVLIIFEMTNTYTIILPLMLANITAYTIAQRLMAEPIYDALLAQSGVRLPSPADDRLARLTVARAMTRSVETLPADFQVHDALAVLPLLIHHGFPVVEGTDRLVGIVTAGDIRRAAARGEAGKTLREVGAKTALITAYPDETLDAIVGRLADYDVLRLPVVRRDDPRRLIGIVTMRDVLTAYARARAAETDGAAPPAAGEPAEGRPAGIGRA